VQYYKPWELLPSEEDIIDDQTKEVELRVDQERLQFDSLRKTHRSPAAEPSSKNSGLTWRAAADRSIVRASPDVSRPEPMAADPVNGEERPEDEPNEDVASHGREGSASVPDAEGIAQDGDDVSLTKQAKGTVPDEPPGVAPENGEAEEGISMDSAAPESIEKETTEHDEDHVVEGEEDTVIY